MAMKKGLGRSFESLIPTDLLDESFDPTAGDDKTVSELRNIKLTEIMADSSQPRQQFDEAKLAELVASIAEYGVLQPIVVMPKNGKYEIVAGERRYRASKMAGKTTIPALVRTVTAQRKLELALIENLHRHDLNSLETATAYAKLRGQFNMTLEQIGASVGGKSASAISNTLRLLKLPKAAQQAIADGKITEGQARPLIDMEEAIVLDLLPRIIRDELSARAVEEIARAYKPTEKVAKKQKDSPYETERKHFEDRLKASVRVTTTARGAGQIVIKFKDQAEFERLAKEII